MISYIPLLVAMSVTGCCTQPTSMPDDYRQWHACTMTNLALKTADAARREGAPISFVKSQLRQRQDPLMAPVVAEYEKTLDWAFNLDDPLTYLEDCDLAN